MIINKFDLRLYVLIKNLDPLEAYFGNEGLVRFCTENYQQPNDKNIDQLYMHLTNFSLNKESENYINPEDLGTENKGSKRLLSQFFENLKNQSGIDGDYIKDQMTTTIKKIIIGLVPYLKNYAQKGINPELSAINGFQVIGIDIMLDNNCKAWLMEINANPSMNMFLEKYNEDGEKEKILSELDKYLKTTVLNDAIKIVKRKTSTESEGIDYGWFEKLLPINEDYYNQFYIFERVRQVFK